MLTEVSEGIMILPVTFKCDYAIEIKCFVAYYT